MTNAAKTAGGYAVVLAVALAVDAAARIANAGLDGAAPDFSVGMMVPTLIVMAAQTAIFCAFASASPFSGASLWLRLALLAVGVQIGLTAVEAYFFENFLPGFTLAGAALDFAFGAGVLAATAFAAARVFGPKTNAERSSPRARGAPTWIWRLVLAAAAYVVVYFGAGALAWSSPDLRAFYGDGAGLDAEKIALIQLGRGAVWALLAWLAADIWGRPGLMRAVMTGFVFSVFMGWLLLYPSPHFPDAVRHVHFVEVSASNFVFGIIAGLLMGPLARRRAA